MHACSDAETPRWPDLVVRVVSLHARAASFAPVPHGTDRSSSETLAGRQVGERQKVHAAA
jgi:hypothetical protein